MQQVPDLGIGPKLGGDCQRRPILWVLAIGDGPAVLDAPLMQHMVIAIRAGAQSYKCRGTNLQKLLTRP